MGKKKLSKAQNTTTGKIVKEGQDGKEQWYVRTGKNLFK